MGRGGRISWRPEDLFGASAVIEGLAALAIAITWVCALIRIKIKGDAARKCFVWLHASMIILFIGYLLSMTASAVYNFLHTPVHYTTYEIEDLLYTGRLLEPMGRMFRRIGAALCAVMIAETAGSISTASAQNPLPLTRAGVHISSIIASVFALAECIIAVLFVNANASSKYSSPRVDDQFNGSKTAMILGGVAVIVLIIGSISVMTAAVKAAKVTVGGELTVPVNLMMAAAAVFLIVRFWSISELSLLFAPRRQDTNNLAWFYIADAVMDRVGTFLVLLSVYYIGVRKKEGLWSPERLSTEY